MAKSYSTADGKLDEVRVLVYREGATPYVEVTLSAAAVDGSTISHVQQFSVPDLVAAAAITGAERTAMLAALRKVAVYARIQGGLL